MILNENIKAGYKFEILAEGNKDGLSPNIFEAGYNHKRLGEAYD